MNEFDLRSLWATLKSLWPTLDPVFRLYARRRSLREVYIFLGLLKGIFKYELPFSNKLNPFIIFLYLFVYESAAKILLRCLKSKMEILLLNLIYDRFLFFTFIAS